MSINVTLLHAGRLSLSVKGTVSGTSFALDWVPRGVQRALGLAVYGTCLVKLRSNADYRSVVSPKINHRTQILGEMGVQVYRDAAMHMSAQLNGFCCASDTRGGSLRVLGSIVEYGSIKPVVHGG